MITSVSKSMESIDEKEVSNGFVFEDKEYHNNVLDNLNMLRRNRQFCDVVLQIGNQQDIHEIYAHKVVLSSASPYLLEMFSNDSSASVQQYKLLNGNYDIEAFDYVVDYAYTARLEVPNDKVRDVYAVANRLKMSSIAYQCGQYLLSTLTPDNCLNVRAIRGVLHDQFLLSSVDNYIRQNILQIVQSKCLDTLAKVQVEFLLNTDEERAATNEKHVFNMVLDWIHVSFDREELNLTNICEKMYMLYFNKKDKILHDCNEIENGANDDSDLIQDYKRESRRLSFPLKTAPMEGQNGHQHNHINTKSKPSKSRQFLFTRSDSESSLSSIADDDNENDWKVLATCVTGKHTLIGLITVSGTLCVLSVKLRVNSPINSPNGSRHHSLEKPELYCLLPPMSSARCAVGTAQLDGKLFVCGGYDRGECLKTVEVYDEIKNKWQKLKHMQVPRGRFDITLLDGNVYAVGGCDGQKELSSAEMYDSKSSDWKQIPNCPVVRSNAGVCNLDGRVYVIGGWNGQRGLTRCDVYDPRSEKWSEIKPLHSGRYQTGVAVLDGVIYAVGGCDSWTCLNSAEKYTNNSWQPIASLHTSRRGCGVAAHNGKLYTVGGHDGIHALCSVEIYDPVTDEWTPGPPLTSCRANVGVAVVGNRLYAVGGFNGKIFLNTIEYLDYETNEWTTSVSKCDILIDNEVNGKQHNQQCNGKEHTNGDINGKFDALGDSMCESHNYSIHSKAKASLNSEPLIEVEESTVGH